MAFVLTTNGPRSLAIVTDSGPVEAVAVQAALSPAAAASAPLTPQPASLMGTLILDPQNISGVANDANPPTATVSGFTGPVFRTYAGLVAAWGSRSPYLTSSTTLVFVSAHVDNTDPIIWQPLMGQQAVPAIQCAAPTILASNVPLAGVVAKNRAAGSNSLLQATLSAAAVPGVLVQNLTHPSRAFAYKALGANAFSMTQPMQASGIGGALQPSEVDTWANGDLVNILRPIAINLVSFEPEYAGNPLAFGWAYQATLFDPNGAGSDFVYLGNNVAVVESVIQRCAVCTANGDFSINEFVNCFNAGGATGAIGPTFVGGCILASALVHFFQGSAPTYDGDFIMGKGSNGQAGCTLGIVFLDDNVAPLFSWVNVTIFAYGNGILYGSGANTIKMVGSAHCSNVTGHTFVATFTAPGLVTGIQLNGAATGSSHTGASPDVLNSAITTTPAHLDAAAGAAGFGGNAFNLGGASVGNFA